MAGNDILRKVAPASDSSLALVANDGEITLVALFGLDVWNDGENDDRAQMTHTLLSNTQKLTAIRAELNTLDGSREVPCLEQAASLDLPQSHGVVGATTRNHGGGGINIDGPDGTLVPLVGAKTFAIVRKPDTDLLVLGY